MTPVNPIGWLVVIALIAGVAWVWQRHAWRKQRYQLDEERSRAERHRQENRDRALRLVNQRPRR